MQTFRAKNGDSQLATVIAWISAAFAIFFIVLAFLPFDTGATNSAQSRNPIPVYIAGAIFFSALAWHSFHDAKSLRFPSIAADKDGLWNASSSKEIGLIPWQYIFGATERQTKQCMDLLDEHGNVLITLSYRLEQFDQLRDLVQRNVSNQYKPPSLPITLEKSFAYHLLTVSSIFGLSYFAWNFWGVNSFLNYSIIAVIVAGSYGYFTAASGVTIARDNLIVRFPTFSRTYSYAKISSVRFSDTFYRGFRHPAVGIAIDGSQKHLRLKNLGINAATLHHMISAAWKEYQHAAQSRDHKNLE